MSTLPVTSLPTTLASAELQPSLTYRVDFENKRISGMIDGIEAIKQTVYAILNTQRYEHLIYSFNYGSELPGLIGTDSLLLQSELKRRVAEALLQDERITAVTDFTFSFKEDRVLFSFRIYTIEGVLEVEKEVRGLG
ncbi:DUF2634 domain-containing protein [Paenibacillus sp. FJAT-26967]|uniref:DUF2634 domain-containing protein n=1 Tax=Paenibacillus sp. FJAT-26967 TaxID=1729690 RepID=UPI000838ED8C|nr:DUF2634 domain-containing protein [Paenibacillus sp. FJAT-26967]